MDAQRSNSIVWAGKGRWCGRRRRDVMGGWMSRKEVVLCILRRGFYYQMQVINRINMDGCLAL